MKAYLTISQGDASLGTLRLSLRPDIVPRTVENFVHFLTAQGNTTSSGSSAVPGSKSGGDVGYKDSTFHRIIPKFMAQGGDFLKGDGTGSTSIYGPSFADENFLLSHSQRGTLSMANSGTDTNGCQFFITFKATAHLDGRHVVFGYVDWRDDDESALVLEKLERVRTDRRNDRPLEPVRIVDCGVIDEGKGKGGTGKVGEGGGTKLAGEAKKNKLLQAYGDAKPAAADDDEIDLDDEDEEGDGPQNDKRDDAPSSKATADTKDDADEIDLEDESDEPEEEQPAPPTGKLSKKAALQKRLAALRKKINQSQTLNRREVRAEAARMGTDEASAKERKRQNKQDRNERKKEYDTYVVGKLRGEEGGDDKAEQKKLASLSQPAQDSIRRANIQADREERMKHGPDDYYNPEGQYSNYERNLNAVRRNAPRTAGEASNLDSYDPTLHSYGNHAADRSATSEREGARRLADEMKRRADKRANRKRPVEFDAEDITSINDRNKRFNRKIGRNFDEHTAEIRQNLERGTAL